MSPAALSNLRRSMRRHGAKRQRRISAILRGFSHRRPVGRADPTIGDLSQAFDTRAFGAFFILFGGLNLVPLPPGASLFFGVPLLLFTSQLALGLRRLWLPERVRRISLSPKTLALLVNRVGPLLRRVERLARMRYWPSAEVPLLMATGWFCLFMALLVAIPFPLTNLVPGVAIALAGVAITARDGLWLIAAVITGIAAVALLTVVYGAAILAVLQFV